MQLQKGDACICTIKMTREDLLRRRGGEGSRINMQMSLALNTLLLLQIWAKMDGKYGGKSENRTSIFYFSEIFREMINYIVAVKTDFSSFLHVLSKRLDASLDGLKSHILNSLWSLFIIALNLCLVFTSKPNFMSKLILVLSSSPVADTHYFYWFAFILYYCDS